MRFDLTSSTSDRRNLLLAWCTQGFLLFAVLFNTTLVSHGQVPDANGDGGAVPAFLPPTESKAFLGVYSTPQAGGVSITGVVPGSAAAKLGLEPGDIVTKIDDFPVGFVNQSEYTLPSEMRRSGNSIKLHFRDVRTGNIQVHTIEVGGRGKNKGNPNQVPRLGVRSTVQQDGVLIENVVPGSAAARAGVQIGDLIRFVDGYRIGQIDGNDYSLDSEIRHAGSACVLTVERGGAASLINVSFSQQNLATNRIHVLLIALTNDQSIGAGVAKNLQLGKDVIQRLPSQYIVTNREISGNQCTAASILDAVQQLDVQGTDAIFCYYGGHGAYDPQRATADDTSSGHFFQIPGGDLMRASLVRALKAKGARLTVLVTDTCNVEGTATGACGKAAGAPTEPPVQTLLMRFHGFIDINGASRDQFGWTNGATGGFFTAPFFDAMDMYTSWGAVLDQSRRVTQSKFASLKQSVESGNTTLTPFARMCIDKQTAQTPAAFEFNVQRD